MKLTQTLIQTSAALTLVACLTGAAQAAIVFSDDFESPDVSAAQSTGYTSGAVTASKWVKATNGFGAGRQGTVDESAGAFTDPVGEQAYAFRYTNSGFTSVYNTIGTLTAGTTITLKFDVVMDGVAAAIPYNAGIILYDGSGTRTSTVSMSDNTYAVLKTTSGSATTDGIYKHITLAYTVGDNVEDNNGATSGGGTAFLSGLLGKDIAIRFKGATNSAIIDNVSVDITAIPEPASMVLMAIGGTMLLPRRRK